MLVKRFSDAKPYEAPNHRDVIGLRLQGFEEGGIRAAYEGKYDAVVDLWKSEDFIEGPKAFAEKRAPNWPLA